MRSKQLEIGMKTEIFGVLFEFMKVYMGGCVVCKTIYLLIPILIRWSWRLLSNKIIRNILDKAHSIGRSTSGWDYKNFNCINNTRKHVF